MLKSRVWSISGERVMRLSYSGNTLAFQARAAGSIPASRFFKDHNNIEGNRF